jgi:hypothetical protein
MSETAAAQRVVGQARDLLGDDGGEGSGEVM